jgi:Histidine kinase-, DNA gyrase B-, and HSP90-like ATPase
LSIDIDEAKKAEDRLRRSEAYLAEAQRLSHVGAFSAVAVHGDEHFRAGKALARRIGYWSEENYRIWGFDPLRGLPDDAFYTTKSSGVGMGLSICRSIIEAHGGRHWAEANALRGAAFRFTLPHAEKKLMNPLPATNQTVELREGTV